MKIESLKKTKPFIISQVLFIVYNIYLTITFVTFSVSWFTIPELRIMYSENGYTYHYGSTFSQDDVFVLFLAVACIIPVLYNIVTKILLLNKNRKLNKILIARESGEESPLSCKIPFKLIKCNYIFIAVFSVLTIVLFILLPNAIMRINAISCVLLGTLPALVGIFRFNRRLPAYKNVFDNSTK